MPSDPLSDGPSSRRDFRLLLFGQTTSQLAAGSVMVMIGAIVLSPSPIWPALRGIRETEDLH